MSVLASLGIADFTFPVLQAWFIRALERSPVLGAVMPEVRRLALVESADVCRDTDALQALFFDALMSTSYLPDAMREQMATAVLDGQWGTVGQLVRENVLLLSPTGQPQTAVPLTAEQRFLRFRRMVTVCFSASRVIAHLPEARRRVLGAAIHIDRCEPHHLIEIAMHAIETSQALSDDAKARVGLAIIDGRYDLLLLPDYMDCEVALRPKDAAEVQEDCPVCLGATPVELKLPCGHVMCRPCVTAWAARHSTPTFSCPLCRADCLPAACVPLA